MEELLIIDGEIIGKKNHLRSVHVRDLEDVVAGHSVIVKKSHERCDPYCKTLSSWYEILLKEGNNVNVFIIDREQGESPYLKDNLYIEKIIADRKNAGIFYIQAWRWKEDKKEIIRYDFKDRRGEKIADSDPQTDIYPGNVPVYVKDRKVRTLDGRILYEIPEGWRMDRGFGYVHYMDPRNYAICVVRNGRSKIVWNRDGNLEEITLNTICKELRIVGDNLVVMGSSVEFLDDFGSVIYSEIYVISNSIIQLMSQRTFGRILTRKEYEFIREILDLPWRKEEIKLNY